MATPSLFGWGPKNPIDEVGGVGGPLGDGTLDFFDVQAFLAAYSASDGLADWNDDGEINFFDLLEYITDVSDGCP